MIKIPLKQYKGTSSQWWLVGVSEQCLFVSADKFLNYIANTFNLEPSLFDEERNGLYKLKLSKRQFNGSQGFVDFVEYLPRDSEYIYQYNGRRFQICNSGLKQYFPLDNPPKKIYFQVIPRSK